MKRKIFRKSASLFLSALLILNVSCTVPVYRADISSIGPLRLTPIDSMTFTTYLEYTKGYEKLLSLLRMELNAIELTEIHAKLGIDLTEQEKGIIVKNYKAEGSKDPVRVFLERNNLTPDVRDYDLEGKLYILDDMARIYTYGLVNFKKAQEYNKRAKEIFEKISLKGIQQTPVSHYYNGRRLLYYFDNRYLNKTSQAYLNEVRKLNFENVGYRIKDRGKFLESKLGDSATQSAIEQSVQGNRKPLEQMALFVQKTGEYDALQANFLLASEAYAATRISVNNESLKDIILYGEKALNSVTDKSLYAQNAVNSLHFWLGFAYLKLGDDQQGIKHMEQFLAGIDVLEKMENEANQRRVEVVKKVNEEARQSAEEKANIQSAFAVLMVVVAIAGGVMALQSGVLSQASSDLLKSSAETMTKGIIAFMEAKNITLTEGQLGRLRAEVARYITPYSLKVNRYLDKYEMVDYFLDLGKAYQSIGLKEKALAHYEEAINIVERQRSTIFTEQQRISFFSAKQELYERIIDIFVSLNRADQAIEYVERAKSRAFVDVLGSSHLQLKNKNLTEQYEKSILTRVDMDATVSGKGVGVDQVNNIIEKAQRSIILIGKKEVSPETTAQDLELLSLSSVQTLNANEIKNLLDADTALLEYYTSKDKLYIFIIQDKKVQAFSIPANISEINTKTNLWRELISKRELIREAIKSEPIKSEPIKKGPIKKGPIKKGPIKKEPVINEPVMNEPVKSENLARYFYDLLIKPIEAKISVNRLVIIPHDNLHYIPFQAIHDGKRYLIERFAISYAPSATVLNFTEQKQSVGNKKALIIGNPTLDLKFAEEEAMNISKIMGGSTLLTKEQVTKAFIKNNAGDYDYIHLATHGVYDEQKPLDSCILLGTGNSKESRLTMSELFSLHWNASLVTLSACETGLSKRKTGDELIGFQRGLIFAGTRSIVSSLWAVDDNATGFLMESFYRNLSSMPKDKALQEAQIKTMKRFNAPYFWAAFNLTGARM